MSVEITVQEMRSYKITVAYDGTDYCGWQWQPDKISIDRVLRDTFLGVFKQTKLLLVGASRTDSGVHAAGQVVRIRTPLSLSPEKMIWVWNGALPSSISIKSLEHVSDAFHPQHDIVRKIYIYTIFFKRPDPIKQRFGWFVPQQVDIQKCTQVLMLFIGTHDFRLFSQEELNKDTKRTVDDITYSYDTIAETLVITVVGKSFLRHMIRRMIGAAIDIASKSELTVLDAKQALCGLIMRKPLLCAPAKGLCLHHIEYEK